MIHPPPRLVPQTDNMDSHFEVILTRVRELTEQSRSVVWFEIPETADGSVVMVLISESNKISMIHVDYSEESAKLNAYKLTKQVYDLLLDNDFPITTMSDKTDKSIEVIDAIKWVTS